ncbi:carbohydrate porin, partial [Klebsiella pneumoniae]|uniref:carbohydrate porin n=1 Tax=Klebsiella pneumoniae TaxID=573 RepID=UPI002381632E
VEVFVNDGEACLSSRIYPQAPRRELALFAWSGSAALNEAGAWSAAAAIESNLVNNAYGYQSQSGRWVDQSNRTGYGLTMS